MKNIFIFCTVVFLFTEISGQCLPFGFTITTQAQITNFATDYPGCTTILGDVLISSGNFDTLEGLEQITTIEGHLIILNTEFISSLTGLDNLTTIGKQLEILQNASLTSLVGLGALTTVTGNSDFNSRIANNNALTSLDGLGNLTFMGGGLHVDANSALSNLTALNNLTSLGGNGADIDIRNNDVLTSLAGIQNINPTSFENLTISGNNLLSMCEVEAICNYLSIATNPAVIATNAAGCNSRAQVEAACPPVGIGNLNNTSRKLSICPNPTTSYMNINAPQEERLEIYNFMGNLIHQEFLSVGINEINLPQLKDGVYFFRTESGLVSKVIVEN